MPIVHMTTDLSTVPAEARNLKLYTGGGPEGLYTYETHNGLCVAEREANFYHDSDFFMIVLNPETDKFEEIMFASTRGWTYPCMDSCRDAPKELLDRYLAEQQARREALEAQCLRNAEEKRAKLIAATGLTPEQVKRVEALREGSRLMLFLAQKVRSPFKLSLRQRVVEWASDPDPAYKTPLSARQMRYI